MNTKNISIELDTTIVSWDKTFNLVSSDNRKEGGMFIAKDKIDILYKNSIVFVKISYEPNTPIQSEIDLSVPLGIFFNFTEFMKILKVYKALQKDFRFIPAKIQIEEESGKGQISICTSVESVSLPFSLSPSLMDEYLSFENYADKFIKKLTPFSKEYFYTNNLRSSLYYVDSDEIKNNAIAIYPDKIVSSNQSRVFITTVEKNIPVEMLNFNEEDKINFFPMHKRIATTLLELSSISSIEELYFSKEGVFVKSMLNGVTFYSVLNNKMSNIVPPSDKDLEKIKPTRLLFTTTLEELYNSFTFFYEFLGANYTDNPITIEKTIKNKVRIYIKDTKTFFIEKYLNEEKTLIKTEENFSVSIIYYSLYIFIKDLYKNYHEDCVLSVYYDDNKPALYIRTEKDSSPKELYLAIVE